MARPIDPMRRSWPFDEWPEQDKAAWTAAVADGDIFDGRGPAAHWAVRTQQTNIQHYGRWLNFLDWSDLLDLHAAPEDRVTSELVDAYISHLGPIVAPRSRLSLLVGLKVTIAAMAPAPSWRWLQDICNRLQRRAQPITEKRSRMRPIGEIYRAALAELEALPNGPLTLKQAIRYRDALILALLSARPLRTRNGTEIALGQHLGQVGDQWRLEFDGSTVKNREPLSFALPNSLVPWLERYLDEVRPLFPGAEHSDRLWLNRYGPVTSPRFIYLRLTKLTRELFGESINPHLLRDCAASSLAMVSADQALAARALLGHRHFSTTERYYIQAQDLEASRRFNDLLAEIEESLEDVE